MRNYQSRHQRDMRNDPETDHYIPNYERDGYVPGPRYGNKPEISAPAPFHGNGNGTGYPMMGKKKDR